MTLETPLFELKEPGSYIYDGRRAARGSRVNAFAQTLKSSDNRTAFKAAPADYLARHDLNDEERLRIARRDYRWLVEQGGHIQCLQRIASVDGHYLFHVAADVIGVAVAELVEACPRRVSGLGGLDG